MHRTALTCGWLALGLGLPALAAGGPWASGPGFRSRALAPPAQGRAGFTPLPAAATGLVFTNVLAGDAYLTNAVAHNGAGVALGDVDGDGWPDIYLCSLQGPNRLFRNLGDWRFAELAAGDAAGADQLSTGSTFADVDGDGDLDLLVNGIAVGTRLFLNDGRARWTEAQDTGLARTASATSLALADMDGDGDLDLYCPHFIDVMLLSDPTTRFAVMRRSDQWEVTKVNGESTRTPRWQGRFEALPDGRVRELPEVHGLYRNEGGGRFRAIEREPGTYADETGKPIPPFRDWGLAAMWRDLNGDGAPDLYVCNDNTSPDRVWLNSGRGTFRALDSGRLRHTSRSSMGVDFGDLNRDGFDDFLVVDMLARDPARRKRQLMRERPTQADLGDPAGRPQFNRNTLYYGSADGSFTEAALFAGVAATDWTWTPLFVDVDLDGFEDILVTNGFESDVMDQDSQNVVKQGRKKFTEAQLRRSLQFHPRWRTANAAFRNRGDGTFEPAPQWSFGHAGVSYGAALADLDGDGDLDVVVNHLNEPPGLYRNDAAGPRVAVRLRGVAPNTAGTGARVRLVAGSFVQSQEMPCGGRYLSGDEALRTFAVPAGHSGALNLEVRWRSGAATTVTNVSANHVYEILEPAGAPAGPVTPPALPPPLFEDVSARLGHTHADEPYDDWAAQPLLPRRLSRLGPGVAWHDFDGDGWEDLAVAAGRGGRPALFRNDAGRGFTRTEGEPAAGDQLALVGWPDGTGARHLLVASSPYGLPAGGVGGVDLVVPATLAAASRLGLGDTHPGPLALADVDGDGDLDVFVGGHFRPGRYPESAPSALGRNDAGRLVADGARSAAFAGAGLVRGATFADLDADGWPDLVLACEWGPVRVFRNERGNFRERTAKLGLDELTGWWTGVAAGDFDGDGRPDLAVGNWGRNSVAELAGAATFQVAYGEWNGDGTLQLIEAAPAGAAAVPLADRAWLDRGLPWLQEKFPTHEAFGQATLRDVLGAHLAKSAVRTAARLDSVVLLNRGDRFEVRPLPAEAQLAPVFSVNVGDADGDGREDLFLSQNFFGAATDLTRDDAGRGLWLRGLGDGNFQALAAGASGLNVLGEQRGAALADFDHDGRVDVVVTQHGGPTRLFANRRAARGLRVVLAGPPGNPDGIGAQLRAVLPGDRRGPLRVVQAGSGYAAQDAAAQVLGVPEPPAAVWVRWPGGREQTVALPAGTWDVRVDHEP